ncbi:MAG: WhiB family transcriptional regulator [Actinomycetia bacterium]|nr:WhiB family transcriptional regulator [Actinomycetes bacterium]
MKGISLMSPDRSWQPVALCSGNHSHLFFPPSAQERKDERQRRETRAKAVCQVCPVVSDCRTYALQIREPYGIWGGLTETERRRTHASAVA